MNRTFQRLLIWSLAGYLVALGALVYPQTVAHAAHHAHHNAATHASALCTWVCAAGQTAETVSVPVWDGPTAQTPAFILFDDVVTQGFESVPSSRGPPSPSL